MFLTVVRDFLNKGSARSILMKKNVIVSSIFQALSMGIQFALVPLTLHYLNPVKFGIWITLSSFVLWFSFLDIGLGNGLKNKLSECLARGEFHLAKTYVSTTYGMLTIISFTIFLIFLFLNPVINWASFFNAPPKMAPELAKVVFWVVALFLTRFVLATINVVFTADQHPSYVNLFTFLGNIISIGAVYVVTQTSSDSLILLGLCISIPPVIVPLVASLFSFRKRFKNISPSASDMSLKQVKPLLTLGLYFFISQLMTLVIYSSDNMIISQVLGPEKVVPYNVAFRYFSIISILFSLASTPLWSAFTHAYAMNDFEWIKNTVRKFVTVWFILIIVIVVMILCSNWVYKLWIGQGLLIPYSLTISMGVFVIQNTWIIIFTYFVGGVGKMRLITIIHIFAGALNIPLCIFFAMIGMGSTGVMLATIICLLPQSILIPIQYKKIINGKAIGIWSN